MPPPRIGFLTERMLLGFGVDRVTHETAQGLAGLGYDVTVFASVSDGTFAGGAYRLVSLGIPASRIFPRYEWNALRTRDRLRAAGIDLFFIETFPLFVLAPFLRAPFVAVEYGVSSTVGFPLWLKAEFLYVQVTQHHVYFPLARHIVTISEFLRDRLPGRLRRRARVIYPGTDHYTRGGDPAGGREAVRRRFSLAADDVLLLYVGRLNPGQQPYKGTARLVESVRRLRRDTPRVQALMVGFGGPEDEAWLSASGIHCWRSAPDEAMAGIYAAADLYVTATSWEGFDLPLAEAQAAGTPAVALRIGAHLEVVHDGETALLAEDMQGFEAAVRRLVADGHLRRRMGDDARRRAARFSWASAVAEYARLVREVGVERGWAC